MSPRIVIIPSPLYNTLRLMMWLSPGTGRERAQARFAVSSIDIDESFAKLAVIDIFAKPNYVGFWRIIKCARF